MEGGRGVIVQNSCHWISWEKKRNDNIRMRLSKVLFFVCFRPTIKFQDGSPVDPLSNPLPTPPLTRPLKNYFCRHFGVSEIGPSLKKSAQTPAIASLTLQPTLAFGGFLVLAICFFEGLRSSFLSKDFNS